MQKICRVCKNERDVRVILDEIWQIPSEAEEVVAEVVNKNQDVFEFENALAV